MTMPAKSKTWTHDLNHRISFTNLTDVCAAQMHAFKEFLKGVSGATVKGSGDNAAAAMDGTDRIAAAAEWQRGLGTTSVHSWIVLTLAGMGGIDLLFEYVGSGDAEARVSYSPSGAYVVNATNARYSPTAADEIIVVGAGSAGAAFLSASASGDRIWHAAKATDGKSIILLQARAGAWTTYFLLGEVVSAVLAPATFSPAVAAVAGTTTPTIAAWMAGILWKCRVNGVLLSGANGASTSVEGTGGTTVPQLFTSVLELQGSQWPILALGLWSQVAGARGKICNLVDIWTGNVAAADGDTYPSDVTYPHQFIALGDFVLPWNGTPSSAGTAPVMS